MPRHFSEYGLKAKILEPVHTTSVSPQTWTLYDSGNTHYNTIDFDKGK